MAAIVIDSPRWVDGWGQPTAPRTERPALRLVGAGTRRPDAQRYRRRRLLVALVVATLLAVAFGVASIALSQPATAGSAPQPRATYVVESGDTYWSIAAARHHGDGDLRIEVDQLIDANDARALMPGDHLELP